MFRSRNDLAALRTESFVSSRAHETLYTAESQSCKVQQQPNATISQHEGLATLRVIAEYAGKPAAPAGSVTLIMCTYRTSLEA